MVATMTASKVREGFPSFTGGRSKSRWLKKVINFRGDLLIRTPFPSVIELEERSQWDFTLEIDSISGQVEVTQTNSHRQGYPGELRPNTFTAHQVAAAYYVHFFGNPQPFGFTGDVRFPAGTYVGVRGGPATITYDYFEGKVVGIHITETLSQTTFVRDVPVSEESSYSLHVTLSEAYADAEFFGHLVGMIDNGGTPRVMIVPDKFFAQVYWNTDKAFRPDHRVLNFPESIPAGVQITPESPLDRTLLIGQAEMSILDPNVNFCPPFINKAPIYSQFFGMASDLNLVSVVDYRFDTKRSICVTTPRFDQDSNYLGTVCNAVQMVGNVRLWRTQLPSPVDDSHTNFNGLYGFLFDAGPPDHLQIDGFHPVFNSPSSPINGDKCSLPPP